MMTKEKIGVDEFRVVPHADKFKIERKCNDVSESGMLWWKKKDAYVRWCDCDDELQFYFHRLESPYLIDTKEIAIAKIRSFVDNHNHNIDSRIHIVDGNSYYCDNDEIHFFIKGGVIHTEIIGDWINNNEINKHDYIRYIAALLVDNIHGFMQTQPISVDKNGNITGDSKDSLFIHIHLYLYKLRKSGHYVYVNHIDGDDIIQTRCLDIVFNTDAKASIDSTLHIQI
jgi:hypothetical protein